MKLIKSLKTKWEGISNPFLIHPEGSLYFNDILDQKIENLPPIKSGTVVALIGDYDPFTISVFFHLIQINAIIMPLTKVTEPEHNYFFETAGVELIIKDRKFISRKKLTKVSLIEHFKEKGRPGLIAFSSGTTGRPKAILHDFSLFLKRFETPRPALRTINFLMFDHVGGLNTLFHTLFNNGVIIVPKDRSVESILHSCNKNRAEVLPATPSFLRMMLISGLIPNKLSKSVKIISYGSERMDQYTLDELCKLLPDVDFRQTFGTSELGVVRVKSEARNSLFMKIGDVGVETKIVSNILYLRSQNRMIGYLNAESPFDQEGWYNTNDVVEVKNGFYKVVGRIGEVINVGGLKFMGSEVERVALEYGKISFVKVFPKTNPITGQHVEIQVEPKDLQNFNSANFNNYLKTNLPSHMMPRKIILSDIKIGNRYKKV